MLLLVLSLCLWSSACKRGGEPGTVVIAVEQLPRGFDPRFSTVSSTSARIMQLVYDTLVVKDKQFDFVPSLATSFETSDDYRTFTFHLRSGVRFQNGKPLTAADVKYTFDSLLMPELKSPIRGALDKIASIETPDSLTVVFRCREPFYTFIGNLPAIGIIPEGAGPDIINAPVGSGPFRFVSFNEGEPVRLEANPDYWDGAPRIRALEVTVIPDNSTRQAALMSGEVDLAYNAQFDPETNRALEGRRGLRILSTPGPNIAHLGVNLTTPILSNQGVRRAVSHAIDRDAIIHGLLRDQARRADSVLPPEQWAYEPNVTVYNYDPNRARVLLDESGFVDPDGDGPRPRFTLRLMTLTTQLSRNIAAIIQEQLGRVGIQVELDSFESATFFDRISKAQFDLYYLISIGGNQGTDIFQFVYHSRYQNQEFNDTITKLRAAREAAEMRPIFDKLAGMLRPTRVVRGDPVQIKTDYCQSSAVMKLVAEASEIDPVSNAQAEKNLYLRIAGMLTDSGGANRSRYCNPEIDELIAEAEQAASKEDKRRLYSHIQKILSDDLPQIYLWYPANVLIAGRRVGSIEIEPSGSWFFIRKITVDGSD
ncbi:MAG TPA: ABC transporter substrate-binding protein [Blastocatellia bacterium]|nr:ABC transporter substrate-binding protein [Blastocatellia bacterium]